MVQKRWTACKLPHLIHMLAKHATPMTASSTTLGRVPAKLSTRVIKTRSMFVLETAAAIVKPPIRSMIVGENITEKTQLSLYEYRGVPGSSRNILAELLPQGSTARLCPHPGSPEAIRVRQAPWSM